MKGDMKEDRKEDREAERRKKDKARDPGTGHVQVDRQDVSYSYKHIGGREDDPALFQLSGVGGQL